MATSRLPVLGKIEATGEIGSEKKGVAEVHEKQKRIRAGVSATAKTLHPRNFALSGF